MPSLFVLVVYCTPVTSFTATISAPTTAALEGSETRPFRFPLGDCANRGSVFSVRQKTNGTKRGKRMWSLRRATDFQVTPSVNSQEDPWRAPRVLTNFRTERMKGVSGIPDGGRSKIVAPHGSREYFATLSWPGFGERQNPARFSQSLATAGRCWRRGRDSPPMNTRTARPAVGRTFRRCTAQHGAGRAKTTVGLQTTLLQATANGRKHIICVRSD